MHPPLHEPLHEVPLNAVPVHLTGEACVHTVALRLIILQEFSVS